MARKRTKAEVDALAAYVTDVTYMSSRYVESDEHGKQALGEAESGFPCAESDADDHERELELERSEADYGREREWEDRDNAS